MLLGNNSSRIERRRGPDFWSKLVNWVAISGWILMLTALVLFGKAKPQTSTFFDRYMNTQIETSWDLGIVQSLIVLMLVVLSSCTIGLLINSQRVKRRDDHYNISLILLGIIAGLVILAFMINFQNLFGS